MSLTVLPVKAQQRDSQWPYVLLASMQVLDVLTTYIILQHWGERAEGNPIARFFVEMGNGGYALLLAVKLTVVGIMWWCQTGVKLVSAIYSLVLLNNFLFLFLWIS